MSYPARARRWIVLLPAVVLAMTAGQLPAASSGPAPDPASSSVSAGDADPTTGRDPASAAEPANATGSTHRITLLTGEVAILHIAADGRQAAWLEEPPAPGSPEPHIFERDGQVHVVPAEAEPYLAAGELDPRLFNVTYLATNGYDDTDTDELPLVLVAEEPGTRRAPATPTGAETVRELPSIGGRSVVADKDRARATWKALRGARTAAPGAGTAELAGAGSVWLNGRVTSMLDESVSQIGAPEAWQDGYDGDGVTVAVLDSGYDPTHPDLTGRVVDAVDFTTDGGDAVDGNGHGTHVAATIAGGGGASDGRRAGVAPGADLLIGRVLDDGGGGFEDWIIAGMEWAADSGADVVNLSLGTWGASDGTDPMSLALNRISAESDTLFVVAAGNTGPAQSTVTSPGAADLALTVGAVTKGDEAAAFSSRGPRWGDGAVKPEVVAPGVGIAAARAGGTSMGNLLDRHYTRANGTSMAAPHVAGAAAILAQRYPELSAEELKARLASTARFLPDESVDFQGAGRVDVPAALADWVTVDSGTLSFGRLDADDEPVTETLTYRNPTRRPVVLQVSSRLDDASGSGNRGRPVLRIERPLLVVPANGSASTKVRVTPGAASDGTYGGRIVARDAFGRSGAVHTAFGFTVETERRTVEITAVDRNGEPAWGPIDFWRPGSPDRIRAWMFDGRGTIELPDGTYTMVAAFQGEGDITVAGMPELQVHKDRRLHFDARDGRRMAVDTPKPTELGLVDVTWSRSLGGESIRSRIVSVWGDEQLYVIGSRSARSGEFEFSTIWQLVEPVDTTDPSVDPTYTYHLAFTEDGAIPVGTTYDAADQPLAEVVSDYRQNSMRMGRNEMWVAFSDGAVLGNGMRVRRNGPVTRTDYLSTEGLEWQRFGQPHYEFANMYWTWSAITRYEPEQVHRQLWWGPLVAPAVPPIGGSEQRGIPVARFTDAIRTSIPHYRYGDGTLHGWIQEQMGDVSTLTLRRNGETVGSSTWSEAQFTVPADDAEYELELAVRNGSGHWAETSTATESTWRFRSGRADEPRTVLPLVELTYDLPAAGERNQVPVGESYPLYLGARYQPGADGTGDFTVTAQVSFDDGGTWQDVQVGSSATGDGGSDGFTATIPAHSEPGFAGIRVIATDRDGNRLDQRIDRGWRIGG